MNLLLRSTIAIVLCSGSLLQTTALADHVQAAPEPEETGQLNRGLSFGNILEQILEQHRRQNRGTDTTRPAPRTPEPQRPRLPGYDLGGDIGRDLDAADRHKLVELTEKALASGQEQSWFNTTSGVLTIARIDNTYTSAAPTSTTTTSTRSQPTRESGSYAGSKQDREYRGWGDGNDRRANAPPLKQVPPIERIDASYRSVRNMRIRGGPGRRFSPTYRLDTNEVIHVVGRVADTNWFLVSHEGRGIGFAPSRLLEPADYSGSSASAPSRPQSAPVNPVTNETRTCRRVIQEAILRSGSRSMANPVFCKTNNGHWERA